MVTKRCAALALACAAALTPVPAASAVAHDPSRPVQQAIAELSAHPPLIISPGMRLALNELGEARVIRAATGAGTPIFIAILPVSAGDPAVVTRQIQRGVGEPGTYLSVVGSVYVSRSTVVDSKALLEQAFRQERLNGTTAVLVRFSELVGEAAKGARASAGASVPWTEFAGSTLIVLLILAGLLLVTRRRRPSRIVDEALVKDAESAGRFG